MENEFHDTFESMAAMEEEEAAQMSLMYSMQPSLALVQRPPGAMPDPEMDRVKERMTELHRKKATIRNRMVG